MACPRQGPAVRTAECAVTVTELTVSGANCPWCFNETLDVLRRQPGVRHVQGSITEQWLLVEHNGPEAVLVELVRRYLHADDTSSAEHMMVEVDPHIACDRCGHRGRDLPLPEEAEPASDQVDGDPDDRRFTRSVRRVILKLSPGELATYGEVALEAGYPGAARAVGNLLARSVDLPWWRVVRADGGLAVGKGADQARRLRAEGVPIRNGRAHRAS